MNRLIDSYSRSLGAWAPAWQAWGVFAVQITVFVVATTFIWERPYHVMPPGWEQDYYYSGQLILDEWRPDSVWHPGTPVQYLSAVILAFVGTSLSQTQVFFNVAYMAAGLALIAGGGVFVGLVLKSKGFVVSLVCLSLIALWTPTLAFMGIWHVEALSVPLALVLWSLLWRALASGDVSRRSLITIGAVAGLAVSVKGTFVVLVVIVLGGVMLHLLILGSAQPHLRRTVLRVLALPLIAALSFLVFTAPVLPRLYVFLERTVLTWRANPRGSFDYFGGLTDLLAQAPIFTVLAGGLTLALVVFVAIQANRARAAGGRLTLAGLDQHLMLGAIGLALMAVVVMSPTIGASGVGAEAVRGLNLRQLTPMMIAVVFVPVLVVQTQFGKVMGLRSGRLSAAVAGVALMLVVSGTLVEFVSHRAGQVAASEEGMSELIAELAETGVDGYRIASASWGGGFLGEAEFHLSGSDLFAGGDYTQEVVASFPKYTLLDLRVAIDLAGYSPPDPSDVGLLKGPLQNLWESWKRTFPGKAPTGELYSGLNSGVRISHVIYKLHGLPRYTDDPERDLRFTIETLYGIASERVIHAGGEDWVVLELATLLSLKGEAAPAP
ncbi:MAG: hypothetical protein O2826_01370 [Chloroflexi bacterium]|nr:hypothetical protein [Chloroflexota bacterium]MDA1173153.1 hypothetical protein [Chloroflexota bacterium]